MGKGRLEAFSDGVIAILITIMVLELKAPQGSQFADLRPLIPMLLAYVLSFLYLGIYWSNHHHLLQTLQQVKGGILWANLHLLFWLSLIPVTTEWLDAAPLASAPAAVYGAVLLMCGIAYLLLERCIIAVQGPHSVLREAVQHDWKGKGSALLYTVGMFTALRWPTAAITIYTLVALLWLVPDRRIERQLQGSAGAPESE